LGYKRKAYKKAEEYKFLHRVSLESAYKSSLDIDYSYEQYKNKINFDINIIKTKACLQ